MARAIQEGIVADEYQILRSIFFKQGLPKEIYLKPSGVLILSQRLERQGFIKFTSDGYRVTALGIARLHALGRSSEIVMIDLPAEMLLEEAELVMQYRVTSSLARQIAERVSGGGSA
jgi:hypothetical protein